MNKRAAISMLVPLDPRGRGNLQQQIYASIRRAILGGVFPPGTRLPSSRDLATDLGISRTTAVLALEHLLSEGYLTTRRGSGTFVAELPDDLPRGRMALPAAQPNHPPLSRRGAALAAIPAAARRLPGPPRAFRIGTPAVDLFPVQLWSQLSNRRLRSITPAQLDYGNSEALRRAIADYVQSSRGTQCAADQILMVAGAQPALDLVCRLLLDPGDLAWMEEPGYPGARGALVGAGARIVPVPVDAEGLDVEAGVRHAGKARLAVVTPSHQFPLGVAMSLPRRLSLLKWASTARAWVVEDDYDSEFRYGARPIPCLHGLDVDSRVIYVGSFSKTVFPALRLGFLIVPPDLYDSFLRARRASLLHPPLPDQGVLADFIADGHFERHLRRMRTAYRERVEALAEAIQRRCSGALRLRTVRTGLHAVADLFGVDDVRVSDEAAARGVEAMPLSAYYFGPGQGARGLVLGFGAVRPDAMSGAVERLAAAIDAARRSCRQAASQAVALSHRTRPGNPFRPLGT